MWPTPCLLWVGICGRGQPWPAESDAHCCRGAMPGEQRARGKVIGGWRLGFRRKTDRADAARLTGLHGRSNTRCDDDTSCVGSVRFECASAAPSPKAQRLVAPVATQCRGCLNEQTEDHRSIIVGEFDQSGFRDQAAEFDKVSRPFAAFHLPCPRVTSCSLRQKPVARCRRPPERRARRRDCGARRSGLPIERKQRLVGANPP